MFGQRIFTKSVFRGEREFYLFYYNAILKDHLLFIQTQSSIKIDITEVK